MMDNRNKAIEQIKYLCKRYGLKEPEFDTMSGIELLNFYIGLNEAIIEMEKKRDG